MAETAGAPSASSIRRFSTIATDPLRNFRFIVEFQDTTDGAKGSWKNFTGGFTSVSGLNITTNPIQYREGGMNTTMHQVPGTTVFQPITLSRGVLHGKDAGIKWMRQLFAAASGEGIPNNVNYRCNLNIYVLDHPNSASTTGDLISKGAYKMKFVVHNAWIQSLSFSDLNASDNQLMYETMSLVHEGLSVDFVNV